MDEIVRLQKIIAAKDAEILMLRAELKRMQQVARRAEKGGSFTIGKFDKIKDKDEKIAAMEAEIARLTSAYGSGSAFKGEYKSKYYSRKPSEKQISALQEWNKLQKEIGRKAAIAKKRSERELKSGTIDRYQTGTTIATHDAVSAVMDLVAEGSNRDELRDDPNLMYAMVDYADKLVGESESKKMGLLTYDQLNELLEQWESEINSAAGETPF